LEEKGAEKVPAWEKESYSQSNNSSFGAFLFSPLKPSQGNLSKPLPLSNQILVKKL
jgi:hypothetical protein